VVNRYGVCPEALDKYGPQTMNTAPTPAALDTAVANYKGGAYHTMLDLYTMKSCLASGYCFVDGIDVYESFQTEAVTSSGEVPLPGSGETLLGGHCTLTFGYDDAHVNLDKTRGALHKRNSWGADWGQKGDFWLPYSYVAPHLSDAWVLHLGKAW
jgi:C1A family cysteine protease